MKDLGSQLALRLSKCFKKSTMKISIGFVNGIAIKWCANASDTNVRRTYTESTYLIVESIPTGRDIELKTMFLVEPVKQWKGLQRALATDSFVSSRRNLNLFGLDCDGGENADHLCLARVLQMCSVEISGRNES